MRQNNGNERERANLARTQRQAWTEATERHPIHYLTMAEQQRLRAELDREVALEHRRQLRMFGTIMIPTLNSQKLRARIHNAVLWALMDPRPERTCTVDTVARGVLHYIASSTTADHPAVALVPTLAHLPKNTVGQLMQSNDADDLLERAFALHERHPYLPPWELYGTTWLHNVLRLNRRPSNRSHTVSGIPLQELIQRESDWLMGPYLGAANTGTIGAGKTFDMKQAHQFLMRDPFGNMHEIGFTPESEWARYQPSWSDDAGHE